VLVIPGWGNVIENAGMLQVLPLRFRHPDILCSKAGEIIFHAHEPFRMRIGERMQERSIDDAENCRGRTNAQGNRQHRDMRESRRLAQHAQSVTNVLPQVLPSHPATTFIEALLRPCDVAEGAEGISPGFFVAESQLLQALCLDFDMSLDLCAEIAARPLASKHKLYLLGIEDASDGRRQSLPLGGFFAKLLAAGRGEGIETRLAVVARASPLRRYPSTFFEPLQRRVEGSVLNQQLFIGGLLDRAGNPLAMLGPEN